MTFSTLDSSQTATLHWIRKPWTFFYLSRWGRTSLHMTVTQENYEKVYIPHTFTYFRTFSDLQCWAFAGLLLSLRRCSVARLTTLKVNNDVADFFWQDSVSLLCICMFYVYYSKNESLRCTVCGILLGHFITCTVLTLKPTPALHFQEND